jgi:hypothetical protein
MKLILLILIAIVATKYVNINFGDLGNTELADDYSKEYEKYVIEGEKCTIKEPLLLKDFIRLIEASKDYICGANKICLLGDQFYVNAKVVGKKDMKDPEGMRKTLGDRLLCGWKSIEETMIYMARECGVSHDEMKAKVTMLLGNHSWDASFTKEARYTSENAYNFGFNIVKNEEGEYKLSHVLTRQNAEMLYNDPKFEVGHDDKNRPVIVYLDIQVMGLICLFGEYIDGKDYHQCKLVEKYFEFQTRGEAKEYLTKLVVALQNMQKVANVPWYTMRLHQPLWNIEGNGEMLAFFWAYKLKEGDTFGNVGVGYSLMELMKQANISFILSAHHHSSHIFAFPYEYSYNENLRYCDDSKDKQKLECVTNFDLFTQNSEGLKLITNTKEHNECKEYLKKSPKEFTYEFEDSPKTLLNFVSGNAKDRNSSLDGDDKTPGALIWGRSIAAGGLKLEISDDHESITFEYFEREGKEIETHFKVTLKKPLKVFKFMEFEYSKFDEKVKEYVDEKNAKFCRAKPYPKKEKQGDKPKKEEPKFIYFRQKYY